MSVTIVNESLNRKRIANPVGQMAPMSRVIDSNIAPCFSIDTGSCVNRSSIGKYFGLGCYSYVADASIGRYCTFASRISIGPFNHPTNWLSIHEFQYRNLSALYGETVVIDENRPREPGFKTAIGSDVWIGDNATVRRGVTIGSGAVIGMAAVVVEDVPPFAIVVGNPARIVRFRFSAAVIESLMDIEWWRLDLEALHGIDFANIENAISTLRERVRGGAQ